MWSKSVLLDVRVDIITTLTAIPPVVSFHLFDYPFLSIQKRHRRSLRVRPKWMLRSHRREKLQMRSS